MRRTASLFFLSSARWNKASALGSDLRNAPIVQLKNATFYRRHPSAKPPPGQDASSNPPMFPDLNLSLPSFASPNQHWAILSSSSAIRTAFLQVLRGQYLCDPPTARSYPYLASDEVASKNINLRNPETAIQYVGFDAERQAFGGAYLSARYESHLEETDISLAEYLTGITGHNLTEEYLKEHTPDRKIMLRVAQDLELAPYFDKPVSNLSNGQSRRARIGKALLSKPEMLLLDAPFIGLDPFVTKHISRLLYTLAEANEPRIVLSLRPQDAIPDWITHLVYAGADGKVKCLGSKEDVVQYLSEQYHAAEKAANAGSSSSQKSSRRLDPELIEMREVGRHLLERGSFEGTNAISDSQTVRQPLYSRDGYTLHDDTQISLGEPLVEMEGVQIKYGSNMALGNWKQDVDGTLKDGLWWNVRRGQRWGIFGANGSGKTTLLALLTSDHPQTYSAPIRIFQRSRLPSPGQPGISIFDIQSRMGHSSPEVHAFFPKRLTVRRTLESAWADTPLSKPALTEEAKRKVDACLRWFQADLNPSLGMTESQKAEVASASDESEGETGQPLDARLDKLLSEEEADQSLLGWADDLTFGEMSLSQQRVALFLRAVIRSPDIVILDEAFSGMDDITRDRCLLFLTRGETMTLQYNPSQDEAKPKESAISRLGRVKVPGLQDYQALLTISHNREEVPGCVREWLCLPEPGTGAPRFGRFDGPVELSSERWDQIWDWPDKGK